MNNKVLRRAASIFVRHALQATMVGILAGLYILGMVWFARGMHSVPHTSWDTAINLTLVYGAMVLAIVLMVTFAARNYVVDTWKRAACEVEREEEASKKADKVLLRGSEKK